jgi:hypothetical protein
MTTLAELTASTPGLPCRTTDPELWFSKSSSERALAQALCRECPVRTACAQYALDNPELKGVWGGTTAADRRSFWDGRPWRFDERGRLRLECGSVSAYHAHFTYREQPCGACAAAFEEQLLAERRRRLGVEHAKGGSTTGYHLHRRVGEPACALCLGAMRAASAAARRRKAGRGLQRARAASGAPASAETVNGAPAAVQPLALAG